jgi:hypothetical protein
MAIKKKSMFFTIIAITLAGIILFSIVVYTGYRQRDKMFVVETRIDTIEDFMTGLDKDLSRGLFISSFRAILALEQYIIENGTTLDSTALRFEEALLNGTVNATGIEVIENSSFTDWINKISSQAEKIDIIINFTIDEISIKHDDPWNVAVEMSLTLDVTDKKNTAAWRRTQEIGTKVSIEGFEDPLYALNSFGLITNTIVNNDGASFSNINTLLSHINNSKYIASTSAPTFLMRLEGNLSNASKGIESLVNIQKFIDQGIPSSGRASVDYIYFGTGSYSTCLVNETLPYYTWFRLDNDHLTTYSVNCV